MFAFSELNEGDLFYFKGNPQLYRKVSRFSVARAHDPEGELIVVDPAQAHWLAVELSAEQVAS